MSLHGCTIRPHARPLLNYCLCIFILIRNGANDERNIINLVLQFWSQKTTAILASRLFQNLCLFLHHSQWHMRVILLKAGNSNYTRLLFRIVYVTGEFGVARVALR